MPAPKLLLQVIDTEAIKHGLFPAEIEGNPVKGIAPKHDIIKACTHRKPGELHDHFVDILALRGYHFLSANHPYRLLAVQAVGLHCYDVILKEIVEPGLILYTRSCHTVHDRNKQRMVIEVSVLLHQRRGE